MKIAFCLVAITISEAFSASIDPHPLSDEFINIINSKQSTWTAGRNFDKNTPFSNIRGLLGALKSPGTRSILNVRQHNEYAEIPDTFDARENWPDCKLIKLIRDQFSCGSCWAVAAASAMSDRVCIFSNGTKQIYVSDEDLVACCDTCGYGCNGGSAFSAWIYWYEEGLSSGGPYNSTLGCKSYSMLPCEHHSNGTKPQCSSYDIFDTPKCTETCDLGSSLDYTSDKSYGHSPYFVISSVVHIQQEILTYGPVEAAFTVYEDFLSYKSGVYQRVTGEALARHAVKVIGWGVERDTPYWLVANSWNEDWGDNGLFKIIRGQNECDFEEEIVAGFPKL